MAQKLRVVKEEIWDLFYNGYSKQEIKEMKFPDVPQSIWNKIWKEVGLSGKKTPFVYEVVSKEDVDEDDVENTSNETPSYTDSIENNQ